MTTEPTASPRGQRITRVDLDRKTHGEPIYASDIRLPKMLHARVVRSPYQHARVKNVDLSFAAETPGYVDGIKRGDFAGQAVQSVNYRGFPANLEVFPETVRYVNEAVAAVVAETEDAAIQAADMVNVDYEDLPQVLTPQEAQAPDAYKLYEQGNLASEPVVFEKGNAAEALEKADHVFEGIYHTPRQSHATIEPVACVAVPEDGRIVIHTVTDSPFHMLHKTSLLTGILEEELAIVSVAGATYGNKNMIIPSLEPVCALLARKTGRPVRLAFSSPEMFGTLPTRHAVEVRLRTGVSADGRLVARIGDVTVDAGAYGMGGRIIFSMGAKFVDLYPVEDYYYEARALHTNTPPGGAYRGVATPQIHFAMETQMNEMAKALGIDPVQLRRTNMVRPGHMMIGGSSIRAEPLEACVDRGAEAFRWGAPKPAAEPEHAIGHGMAVGMHHTGLGKLRAEGSIARARLLEDGTVEVGTAIVEKGQGAETALAQIAADALGVSVGSIRMVMGDTRVVPVDEIGAEVNRATYIGGLAAREAALKLRSLLAETLGARFETSNGNLVEAVTLWREATGGAQLPEVDGTYVPEEADPRPVFSSHFAEVDVDLATGETKLLRYVAAQDVGEAINPDICESQIEGGVYHQAGFALREELLVSDGLVQNGNYMEYSAGGFGEAVPIEVVLVETPGEHPKGVGTSAAPAVAPAIAAAIGDAIGVFPRRIPATGERVLDLIESAENMDAKR